MPDITLVLSQKTKDEAESLLNLASKKCLTPLPPVAAQPQQQQQAAKAKAVNPHKSKSKAGKKKKGGIGKKGKKVLKIKNASRLGKQLVRQWL